jgi:hypothetical protein
MLEDVDVASSFRSEGARARPRRASERGDAGHAHGLVPPRLSVPLAPVRGHVRVVPAIALADRVVREARQLVMPPPPHELARTGHEGHRVS